MKWLRGAALRPGGGPGWQHRGLVRAAGLRSGKHVADWHRPAGEVQLLALQSDSGYNLARMRYEIIFAPEAVDDLRSLKASLRSEVRDAIELHLRHLPTR